MRNFCAQGRIAGARLIGKPWYIPIDAQKRERANKKKNAPLLLEIPWEQKAPNMTGDIYNKVAD